MYRKPLPDQALLNKLLRYEPDTGRLFWRERGPELFDDTNHSKAVGAIKWNATYANTEAFTAKNDRGYKRGLLLKSQYKAHRIIFKMVYGEDPDFIDHINMDRGDNRLCNLRSVTHAENCAHMRPPGRTRS